jgi:PAS domain S-box-containing protein
VDFAKSATSSASSIERGEIGGSRLPSLRRKLAWVVVACLAPALAGMALLAYHSYQEIRAEIEREALQTARALAQVVDQQLGSAEAASMALATSTHLANDDLAAFDAQAHRALAQLKSANNFVLLDRAGQQLVNTLRPLGEALPPSSNPHRVQRVFNYGSAAISDVYIDPVRGTPTISIDVPVWREGKVIYDLSAGFVPAQLDRILSNQRLPPGWISSVFDSAGSHVARTHDPENFVGREGPPALVQRMGEAAEGIVETSTSDAIPVLAAFSHSAISNWAVAINVPRAILWDQLWRSLRLVIAASGVMLLLGSCLAWAIGGQIAASVRALIAPATALGSGEAMKVPRTSFREAGAVVEALVSASELLQRRTVERDLAQQGLDRHRRDLETIVADRTVALEAALADMRLGEERFRATFEQAAIGFTHVAFDGQLLRANARFCEIVGYSQDELKGLTFRMLTHPDDLGRSTDPARLLRAGEAKSCSFEKRYIRKDGEAIWAKVTISVQHDAAGSPLHYVAVIEDIQAHKDAEQRKDELEAQLRQSQRLEALGTLAGGIAHDLNNALTPVILISGAMLDDAPQEGRDRELLGLLAGGAKRARDLVRRILTFARKDEPRRAEIDLAAVVKDAFKLLRASIPATISISERVLPVPPVLADEGQLHQVLTNLVTNAAQAIGDRIGTITVELSEVADAPLSNGGTVVRITVSDTGCGMDEPTRLRIFDPFYTTRSVGEGTGLGLSVVHGIVTAHGGTITVESEPGHGSRFDIYLPIAGTVAFDREAA